MILDLKCTYTEYVFFNSYYVRIFELAIIFTAIMLLYSIIVSHIITDFEIIMSLNGNFRFFLPQN